MAAPADLCATSDFRPIPHARNATMKAAPWRLAFSTAPATARARREKRCFAAGALVAALLLAHCSALSSDAAPMAPPSDYGVLIANALKSFKGFAEYGQFQISGLRWVHATTGWSWLACVRYQDHGHPRVYAFFINNGAVVNARYDIVMDQCGAQQYVPFDPATGTIATPPAPLASPSLPPPNALSPLRDPIY